MKRKIYSVFALVFVLFACMFASACGDRYKNLEFKVLYAFSADAEEWYDGTNGISLNYDLNGEDDSSLVFDSGMARLYVKIEIHNVKEKHIDSITITSSSLNGLNFSSKRVKENDIFDIVITGNVNSTLKLYENNSGHKLNVPFVVSRTLESMEAETSIKPAMSVGDMLPLSSLNNLKYYPLNQTNQIGSIYSVESIGYYNSEFVYTPIREGDAVKDCVLIEDGILRFNPQDLPDLDLERVVKIKATSKYHDGSINADDEISTIFYVYLVDTNLDEPEITFDDLIGKEVESQVSIYENGGDYSTATINVNTSSLDAGFNTSDSKVSYKIAFYVKNSSNNWEKYDFYGAKHQAGLNGLIIKEEEVGTKYSFAIADRNVNKNEIKCVYEIEGLTVYTNSPNKAKEFSVLKSVLPTCITINDTIDKTGETGEPIYEATVFGTDSASYKGLELKLSANPNNDINRKLILTYDENALLITGGQKDANGVYNIVSGNTIFVKFKESVSEAQTLEIKTLKDPTYYNESEVTTGGYITIACNISKLVTADDVAFVDNEYSEVESVVANASNASTILVKVNYTGTQLDRSTVKVVSDNEFVVFGNNSNEIKLNDINPVWQYTSTTGEKFDVYPINIKTLKNVAQSNITIIAADGHIGVEKTMTVTFVNIISTNAKPIFDVNAKTNGVNKFTASQVGNGAFNFAVSKNEFVEFEVTDGDGNTNTIAKIELVAQDLAEPFSKTATNFNVISNSTFVVTGKIANKTQVLTLKIYYYISNNNQIELKTKEDTVQIAVYEAIGYISTEISKDKIGFVNPYFTETSSTSIEFNSYTLSYGTPAENATFLGASSNILAGSASQIQVEVGNALILSTSGAVEIKYVYDGGSIDLLASNSTVLKNNGANVLNGRIEVKLLRKLENVKEISLTLRALRFGQVSSVLANAVISIVGVDVAEKIQVSGNELVEVASSVELRLSFMEVADGGYDEAIFNAGLIFANNQNTNNIRFTDIETALTHVLYQYIMDSNNNVIEVRRIQNDFLTISYNQGVVSVKAHKRLGGGLFKLVLATKDSYKLGTDPDSIVVQEGDFDTTYSIVVRVEDGVKEAYVIETEEELFWMNYNLSSKFALGANLDITNKNFSPIGLIGTTVNEFNGTFSSLTAITNNSAVSIIYSIKLNANNTAISTTYGTLAGLFGIIGSNGKIENINLNVAFANGYFNATAEGLKVGALAGVNKGTIKNVNVVTEGSRIALSGNSTAPNYVGGSLSLGGIVGLNENSISNSTFACDNALLVESSALITHSIGLIAGTNATDATITGSYISKESLNNFVFDVVANLSINNVATSGEPRYNVGSAVGTNNGIVKGLLVGGQIIVGNSADNIQKGDLGGIVGISTENSIVETSVAMSLNLVVNSDFVNVGGVVGAENNATITNVKFVSVETNFGFVKALGTIKGKNLVGGVVAKATNGSITYASVESFIETIKDEATNTITTFYTLTGNNTVAGLVANISGTNVDKSFVTANIYIPHHTEGTIILTTPNNGETNTYFIGGVYRKALTGTEDVEATTYTSNASYKVVNGSINVSAYMSGATVGTETTDWTNIYIDNEDGSYTKATSYDVNYTYVKFNTYTWVAYVKGLVSGGYWKVAENYNVVNINGVDLYLPYIITDEDGDYTTTEDQEAVMIIAPLSISASIDADYVTSVNSVHVKVFNYSNYNIKESIIVNYYNDAKDEDNTHNIVCSSKDANDGLLKVDILPEDAQGGYAYEILGNGYKFAYINSSKKIVITGASGQTPILVRIYSVFDTEVEAFVAIYTQCLLDELKLNSNSIYYVNETNYAYEMNLYTGQSNKIISIDATNNNSSTILEVKDALQYLKVGATTTSTETKLDINTSSINNITLKIKEDAVIPANYSEIITFTLYLDKLYFKVDTTSLATEDVPIAVVTLKVSLYNSATSIDVVGEDAEKTTNDDISFDVYLTTDYVNKDEYTSVSAIKEDAIVDNNGNIVLNFVNDHDAIKISLNIVDGEQQINELVAKNNVDHFAELFYIQIISSLYKAESDAKVIGYKFNVMLELKDEHNIRYVTNNIKFNILVTAISNPDVSNKNAQLEILFKPTVLSTVRMENYSVKSLNVNTDYTSIVTNKDIETSIIEPGSLGNVMLIYLEPTYSNVVSAKIKTSELMVPSLGRNVKMKFTQLVHDYRKSATGMFTTLYGADVNSQVDDTLELKLVSTIDAQGNRIYTGIICVYIQLEKFGGLEASMSIQLDVETSNGKTITRTRDLLTTYLPEVRMVYNAERAVEDGYLIQKGTSTNEVKIKIFGYQFNSNPDINFSWKLPDGSNYEYDGNNTSVIKPKASTDPNERYLIGDYVSYYLVRDYNDIVYNSADNSYTLSLIINVSEDIVAPFTVGAKLSLVTKDGQLKTSDADENKLIFYPTDYILNSVYVANLSNGNKNIAINKSRSIDFVFNTDSEVKDLNEPIYNKLLAWANESSKVAGLFSYFKNGGVITFADSELHPEFEFHLVNNTTISITGVSKFTNVVEFKVTFGYADDDNDGVYELNFGEHGTNKNIQTISTTFVLNVYAVDKENLIIVYSADEIFNSATGSWDLVEGGNYVLMNDIELENVVPITTPIGSFDGNNRVISIKSFRVDPSTSEYGLFANIGTYTVKDEETEQDITYKTLLKNVIVDYSKFNGTLVLTENTTGNITFGGLVANNNGGLIYNCDVINLNTAGNAEVDVIVPKDTSVVFGGLVGINSGTITNSRVGRDSYTKIVATTTLESSSIKRLGGLSFNIYNSENANDAINQFTVVAGGFVGTNNGTIATSFVEKTNLTNYSTNETNNITAGFVGSNTGSISYSYVKADETTITISNPYAKGYKIENKGNGVVAGFVYNNSGTISNSYSNTELKTNSAYISGFVYTNAGTITESYAACTMNSGLTNNANTAEQPFIGLDNANNLLSFGTIERSYYLMRSNIDMPYTQDTKDVANGLNAENFQHSENLIGFAFILSNSKQEREQGIWSYYSLDNKKRILPELMNADYIAHSYRYVVDESATEKQLRNAISYAEGTNNNPYTVSTVEEFNKVFTENNSNNRIGYIRFIDNINFNNDETALKTRYNYTLGSTEVNTKTSVEGNGMTLSGIYLDVGEAKVERIGLFAQVINSYIKNLNINFATPTTDGQFSTTTATYSGGLAGTLEDSVVINVKLSGTNTTLTGNNFVGGLAGLVKGKSLIYGVETNLNVKASSTNSALYYSEADYKALNIGMSTYLTHDEYLKTLSYAGGLVGVLDLTKNATVPYNLQFIDIRGDQMNAKTFNGQTEANIIAEYAGGVAGYASSETDAFKLKYFVGSNESIRGNTAVGGLYGIGLGEITASQVTAVEDTQFAYDTKIGEYITQLETEQNQAELDLKNIGNTSLLESNKYAGGLVGIGLNAELYATYSKVAIKSGTEIGGLIGLSVASKISFSYSIPYINFNDNIKYAGGLIGSAYAIVTKNIPRNGVVSEYIKLLEYKGAKKETYTNLQFTYSTLILDNLHPDDIKNNAVFDYICANYKDDNNKAYIYSNANSTLMFVYAGTVNYKKVVEVKNGEEVYTVLVQNQTAEINSSIEELYKLYNTEDPSQVVSFQEIFSGWSVVKYWSLNEEKYFPLLNDESADNFIDIHNENELQMIASNPNGKFRVVNDFTISTTNSNWIIDLGSNAFEGVLIGDLENDNSRRPIITINGLKPKIEGETSGFFRQTKNATISNLSFEWISSTDGAIKLTKVNKLNIIGGLTCDDSGSLITNVEVRASGNTNENGYIIDTDKSIAGFGGIVGKSLNSNILGCTFAGKVNAQLGGASDIYVGGIVASAETRYVAETDPYTGEVEAENNTSVINNVIVGSSAKIVKTSDMEIYYPKTSFEISIAESNSQTVYVGGVVGYSDESAIASASVGDMENEDEYKKVDIILNVNKLKNNTHVGGIVGYAKEGMILSCDAVSNIYIYGQTDGTQEIEVGGLAGTYHVGTLQLTSGIKESNAQCNINTLYDGDNLNAINSLIKLSTGVATLSDSATLKQCYFGGEINTEDSYISNVYAGGAVAYADGDGIDLEEVTTYSALQVGSLNTTSINVGGLIGYVGNAQISYCASMGRIIPITSDTAIDIYAGGLVGKIEDNKEAKINNSYTISSIIADSIADNSISKLSIGPVVGKSGTATFSNVYYSSDYGLFADESEVTGKDKLTNLSAQTMIYSNIWHKNLATEDNVTNSVWNQFVVEGSNARLPYITSLEETLKTYGILEKPTGKTYYDYAEGTAMRPRMIVGNTTFSEEYTYYILTQRATTPTFTGELNGFLLGQDLSYENSFALGQLSNVTTTETYKGIVPKVLKHSVVSNLHVKAINAEIQITDGEILGLITGLNEGVIFNSSIQGYGNTIVGDGKAGIIVGKNTGLISYCYSSAEIKQTIVETAGIVHTNIGKLLSNYFTGYISTEENKHIAGITVYCEPGYIYNNYMAGVIQGGTGDNNFYANSNGIFVGENNFIDSYSDLTFEDTGIEDIIDSCTTAELMAGGKTDGFKLNGAWYTTVEAGNFKRNANGEIETSLRVNPTFGLNYNYPVYKFNKMVGNSTVDFAVNDWKNQLYTGTGLSANNADSYSNRYNALMDNNSTEYKNAYKIPHLGVLTSIQNLINENRDFVVVYDLDGAKSEIEYTTWEYPIGSDNDVNGFKRPEKEGVNNKEFNALFISNKYYNKTEDVCVIKNLDKFGLFKNINQAYFADINFGNFSNLSISGVLGTNVGVMPADNETQATPETAKVIINNIGFIENTKLTGADIYSDGITSTENYFGGLFGKVDGTLIIDKFNSAKESTCCVELINNNKIATVGLIAGKLNGTLILEESESTYYSKFIGNSCAGGLLGILENGTILGNKNTVTIINNSSNGENVATQLGGIVGNTSGISASISEVNVEIKNNSTLQTASANDENEVSIDANIFGGVVAVSSAELTTITDCAISAEEGSVIKFYGQGSEIDEYYYGLLAGKLIADSITPEIKVETGTLETGFNITNIKEIKVPKENNQINVSTNVDILMNSKNYGLGTFVGYQKGNLKVPTIACELTVTSELIPNVGGIAGYYEFGSVDIPTDNLNLTVQGYVNLGGVFGYCNCDIVNTMGSLLNSENEGGFAKVVINSNSTSKNIGGLFGTLAGGITGDAEITNRNNIEIPEGGTAYNVGGIAGRISAGIFEAKFINYANIQPTSDLSETFSTDTISNKQGDKELCKLVNVGGIAGLTIGGADEGNGITINNAINQGTIQGYQNVGGIIGYGENVKLSNDESIKLDSGKTTISASITEDIINASFGTAVTGTVYGVLNIGGAFGYAGTGVEIEQVYSTAKVYGNTNVGGLVGFAKGITDNVVSLKNNYVKSDEVKGVYYELLVGENETRNYLPTSVGGVIGTAINTTLSNNIVNGVTISSTPEENLVISTISNYITQLQIDTNKSTYCSYDATFDFESVKNKYEFSKIKTGYGGFIGTTESVTVSNSITTNIIKEISINAQLGVNVGTYYGTYKYENSINSNGQNMALGSPTLYGNINVDGAYNIGGIVGLIDGAGDSENINLSNANLSGSGTIKLQSNLTGMYVGGLIGKTNANRVSGLEISSGQAVNINIDTSNSYYLGGLIGKAEVTANATISGCNVYQDYDGIIGSNADNFGAFIGMLKIAQSSGNGGFTIKVNGTHYLPFTINTIENSNYYDGDSRYNSAEDDEGIALTAEAYYINKDSFEISGSSTTYTKNPLNDYAQGWSKEYTGFRQIQRCIPQSSKYGAEWDSIAVLYDAANVIHVGTIANLGLSGQKLPSKDGNKVFADNHICFTIYEQRPGYYTLYSAMGIATALFDYREYVDITDPSYTGQKYDYNEDTGVAKEDDSGTYMPNPQMYFTPKDNEASAGKWFMGVIMEETPAQAFYLDANNPKRSDFQDDNGNVIEGPNLQGLTYFEWQKKYYTIGGNEKTYQQGANETNLLTYFVKDFLRGDPDNEGDAEYKGYQGAYFVFRVVYNNITANGMTYDETNTVSGMNNNSLPASGSIFHANGVYSSALEQARENDKTTDLFGVGVKVTFAIVDVAILIVTFGSGNAILSAARHSGKMAAKHAAKHAVKAFAKASLKTISRQFKKMGRKALLKAGLKRGKKVATRLMITIFAEFAILTAMQAQKANQRGQDNFLQPQELNYGFLGNSYRREINYTITEDEKVILAQQTDDYIVEGNETYQYYSSTRPSDYQTSRYLAQRIEVKGENWNADTGDYGEYVLHDVTATNVDDDGQDAIVYLHCSGTEFEEAGITLRDEEEGEAIEDRVYIKKGETPSYTDNISDDYYLLVKKYIIKNGLYYINCNAGEIELNPVTLKFKPEKDAFGDDLKTPNYIEDRNKIYVHGNFNGEDYKYAKYEDGQWKSGYNYIGNLLEYNVDTNTYKLGNMVIENANSVEKTQKMQYIIRAGITTSAVKSLGYVEGYNYFTKAYYTANGNSNLGKTLYATFVRVENPTAGMQLGIDYIYGTYPVTTYTESAEGTFKLVGSSYMEIDADEFYEGTRYAKQVTSTPCYYQITNLPFETSGTHNTYDEDNNGYITVAVYPYSFTNPYYNKEVMADAHDGTQVETEQYLYWYTDKAEDKDIAINARVTYFAYEGGYMVEVNDNYNAYDIAKEGGWPIVYIPMEESKYMKDEIYASLTIQKMEKDTEDNINLTGTIKTITFKDLIDNWNTYKSGWYLVDYEQPLDEVYQVKDGTLYAANSQYTLDENGRLCKINVSMININENANIYENMYLTNSTYKFYTRYKYYHNGNEENFTFDDGTWPMSSSSYRILPEIGTSIGNRTFTYLEESVRVILAGGNCNLYKSGTTSVSSGSITIN